MMISVFKNILKNIYFKIKYVNKHIKFDFSNQIAKNAVLSRFNKFGRYTAFAGKIGLGSYIGSNCNINASIGKFCSIANNVTILSGNHPTKTFVSTSPSFYSTGKQNYLSFVKENIFDEKVYADADGKYAVVIGNDVWVGFGVTIVGGVKIGDGAVIASGAVVAKDVAPYTIVGGVPAKEIRKRFDPKTIEFLLEFKWWDKPISWLKENAACFSDIDVFLERFKGEIE